MKHLGELRKKLVAERCELILAAGALVHQLKAMSYQSLQAHSRFRRRQRAARELAAVRELDAFLQLVIEVVGQIERVPFIGLGHATRPRMHVDEIDREILFQQILHKG